MRRRWLHADSWLRTEKKKKRGKGRFTLEKTTNKSLTFITAITGVWNRLCTVAGCVECFSHNSLTLN